MIDPDICPLLAQAPVAAIEFVETAEIISLSIVAAHWAFALTLRRAQRSGVGQFACRQNRFRSGIIEWRTAKLLIKRIFYTVRSFGWRVNALVASLYPKAR